ncbi:MAG: CCA tRNA nucleotidyltransferase [Desulfuromusa sp.]|nr:CCA tRNA nucleotidyltransferase [Desulfuromusa sp.]
MFSQISSLLQFIELNPDLKSLIAKIQKCDDDFWLVGGCLRNFLLDLPQNDIDIACSADPTVLTRAWASKVSGRWFWLDEKRRQSRVLLRNGLILDFAPLRASTITKDLQLRDFTINALALPLDQSFPQSLLHDPTNGVNDLKNKQLVPCSSQSFHDDPLRMLKGIRHAVTLSFTLSANTQEQIIKSAHLLVQVAGERIRDELGKILEAENVVNGVELLIDTGVLESLLGPAGHHWDRQAAVAEIDHLNAKIEEAGLTTVADPSIEESSELFSTRAIFLLARLLDNYSPSNLTDLLHQRLRLSRHVQRVIEQLQTSPAEELFSLAATIEGQRRQALLVEQMKPFAVEKMVYWGVYGDRLTRERVEELQQSFTAEQKFGRIPDLLDGRVIAAYLGNSPNKQIAKWQQQLKLAEINGEISTDIEAEKWVESHQDP